MREIIENRDALPSYFEIFHRETIQFVMTIILLIELYFVLICDFIDKNVFRSILHMIFNERIKPISFYNIKENSR